MYINLNRCAKKNMRTFSMKQWRSSGRRSKRRSLQYAILLFLCDGDKDEWLHVPVRKMDARMTFQESGRSGRIEWS